MTLPEPEVRSTRQHIATQWHIMGGGSVLKCKCGDWKSDPSQTAPQQREAHRDHREAMGETVLARQKKTGPEVRITRYEVSCLPRDHEDASIFTVVVENVGNEGRWVVKHGAAYLSADFVKSWGWSWPGDKEPVTDEEHKAARRAHDEWLASRRFDHDTALRIAREYAPQMRYRDYTVADALSRIAEREAKG